LICVGGQGIGGIGIALVIVVVMAVVVIVAEQSEALYSSNTSWQESYSISWSLDENWP
jgi:hypothetical protein